MNIRMTVPTPQVMPKARANMETLVLWVINCDEKDALTPSRRSESALSSMATRSEGDMRRCDQGIRAPLASGSRLTASPPKTEPSSMIARHNQKTRT